MDHGSDSRDVHTRPHPHFVRISCASAQLDSAFAGQALKLIDGELDNLRAALSRLLIRERADDARPDQANSDSTEYSVGTGGPSRRRR